MFRDGFPHPGTVNFVDNRVDPNTGTMWMRGIFVNPGRALSPGIFIRSMASRGKLGGLAAATTDLALLFDAAGMNTILIETVGVGQDEIDIARLADVTALSKGVPWLLSFRAVGECCCWRSF